MKLLKTAIEQDNVNNSERVIYENVHFPLGFVRFLEALEISHIIPANYVSESVDGGYVWCDTCKEGGVRILTSDHPSVVNNHTALLVVDGIEESQAAVKQILKQHSVTYTPPSP